MDTLYLSEVIELKKDVYGILKNETEVDTDVNEDQNREALLDESLNQFVAEQNEKGTSDVPSLRS